tara:strand:+ start:59 stop:463 length:405 start_codon:yes stop_codon:yes gene_type:complete
MGFSKVAYAYGRNQEHKLKPVLEKYFNTTLEMPNDRFCKYDYYDDKREIELKSRKITSDRYNTYHLGKGKIDYAKTTNKDFFIVLNFTDKIMICDYSEHKEQLNSLVGKEVQLVRGDKCLNVEIPSNLFCELSV